MSEIDTNILLMSKYFLFPSFLVAKPCGQSQTRAGNKEKNQPKNTGKSKQQYWYMDRLAVSARCSAVISEGKALHVKEKSAQDL